MAVSCSDRVEVIGEKNSGAEKDFSAAMCPCVPLQCQCPRPLAGRERYRGKLASRFVHFCAVTLVKVLCVMFSRL